MPPSVPPSVPPWPSAGGSVGRVGSPGAGADVLSGGGGTGICVGSLRVGVAVGAGAVLLLVLLLVLLSDDVLLVPDGVRELGGSGVCVVGAGSWGTGSVGAVVLGAGVGAPSPLLVTAP